MQSKLQIPDIIINAPPKQRIAIVENDFVLRHAIEEALQAAGYDTCAFSVGEELLGCVEHLHVDGFLLSMDLPGMSGVDIRKALSAQGQISPVLFMTIDDLSAYTDQHLKEHYLHKPFRSYRLVTAVRSALKVA